MFRTTHEQRAEALRLRAGGMSLRQIAKQIGTSHVTVARVCAGVEGASASTPTADHGESLNALRALCRQVLGSGCSVRIVISLGRGSGEKVGL